jgi:O-antigen/teichoic acid export membrane protein
VTRAALTRAALTRAALTRAALTRAALTRAARAAAAPLIVAVAVQSVGNLVFHAVVGRLLDDDGYGALGAVLAAMTMLGVPLGALQAAASALVAERGGRAGVRLLRPVAGWATVPAAVVLLATPAVQGYFHLGSWWDAALLGPYLAVAAVLAAARGLLLGARRTAVVGHTYLIGTAARLALGLALAGPFGMTGALVGTLLGEVASLVVALAALRAGGPDESTAAPAATLRLRAVARAAVALTGLFLFSTVDLLLARHHLGGAESGGYVAAATVAKTVLAVPAAMMSAVFPRLVTAWRSGPDGPVGPPSTGRALVTGGGLVVLPALLAAGVVMLAPRQVLGLLYGDRYVAVTTLTQVLCAVAALTAVVSLLTHAALARRSATLALPWLGAALQVVLIELRHASAAEIAIASVLALVPTLLVVAAVEGRAWHRGPKPLKLGTDAPILRNDPAAKGG